MKTFALLGVAGFVAPRHLQAIHATGNHVVAASDPRDSVGILDRYFPDARYFPEIERFDRFLERRRRSSPPEQVDYISICTPNYLHDAHVRLALRLGANAICEKPLTINPWNLAPLEELEAELGRKVYTVLQLRLHPAIASLYERVNGPGNRERLDVQLTYVTPRGRWYHASWKGAEERSGGLATNIGIHFFDLMLWLFGGVEDVEVHLSTQSRLAGVLRLERATASWFLSIDAADLGGSAKGEATGAYRSLRVAGSEILFSDGGADLHTLQYEEILAGRGVGIADARPGIELVHRIRQCSARKPRGECHPWVPICDARCIR